MKDTRPWWCRRFGCSPRTITFNGKHLGPGRCRRHSCRAFAGRVPVAL